MPKQTIMPRSTPRCDVAKVWRKEMCVPGGGGGGVCCVFKGVVCKGVVCVWQHKSLRCRAHWLLVAEPSGPLHHYPAGSVSGLVPYRAKLLPERATFKNDDRNMAPALILRLWYMGRRSSQRGLGRSPFCNQCQVSVHGTIRSLRRVHRDCLG